LPSLDIGFNFFTGTLPPELGKMSHLKRITAPFNFFEGQVPSEIGILKELVEVNLTANV
jgi:protein brassinosteroid insensitive 1